MTDQEIYIYGANMLTIHLICIQIVDVQGAMMQLLSLLVIRLIIGNFFVQLSLACYALSFATIIMLSYVVFLQKKDHRTIFLQNKRESQWGNEYLDNRSATTAYHKARILSFSL